VTRLDLSKKDMGANAAKALSEAMGRLEEVIVAENPLGDEGVQHVAAQLPNAPALRLLDLAETGFTASAICTAIGTGASVMHTLILACNKLGPEGVAALAVGLPQAASLTELDLQSTAAGDAGARALSEALQLEGAPTALKVLRLDDCAIGAEGGCEIARALPGTGLTLLSLGKNPLTAATGQALGEALAGECSVLELNLAGCSLGAEGLAAVARARHVQTLALIGNIKGDQAEGEGICGLATTVAEGGLASVHTLDLCCNEVSPSAAAALCQALALEGTAPQLRVLELGGNADLADAPEFEDAAAQLKAARPDVDVVWKQRQGAQGGGDEFGGGPDM